MGKVKIPDGWEVDTNTGIEDVAPDNNLTQYNVPNRDYSVPWLRNPDKSMINGRTVSDNNKHYNELSSSQLQQYLSDVYNQRIYRDEEGLKYQLTGSDGQRHYLKNQKQPTSYLYGGGSKTDPNVVKFGVGRHGVKARYAPKSEWKRYGDNKSKSKGYPSGPEGIDDQNAFMDWELPRGLAEKAEKYIHGNFGNIDGKIMFDDETLRAFKVRESLGSGASEYYDSNKMKLMNLDESELPDASTINEIKPIPTEMGGDIHASWEDEWEVEPSIDKKALRAVNGVLQNTPTGQMLDMVKDTGKSMYKIGEQAYDHGVMPTLRDAGRGLTAGAYDAVDVVTSLGGLVPNPVSRGADEIADNIRASNEIPDSEIERVAELATEGASGGVVGGIAGKAIGTGYNALRGRGEDLAKRATVAATGAHKRAIAHGQTPLEASVVRQKAYENMTQVEPRHSYTKALIGDAQPVAGSSRIDPIPYSHPMSEEDFITKAVRERNHMEGRAIDKGIDGMSARDIIDPVGRGNLEYPTPTRLLDTAIHNVKRQLGNKAMLKRNEAELDQLFSQGNALDQALAKRQNNWDHLPDRSRDAGTIAGMVAGPHQGF